MEGDGYIGEATKICKVCGKEKPLSEFRKMPKMRDGYANQCKVCSYERDKTHALLKREEIVSQGNGFKTCSECGRTLPATTEFFNRRSASPDGYSAKCKHCSGLYDKKYRARNGDEIKAKQSRWHRDNKGNHERAKGAPRRTRPIQRALFQTCSECGETLPYTEDYFYMRIDGSLTACCKDCTNDKRKEYREEHADEIKTVRHAKYERNKETVLERNHTSYRKHREKRLVSSKKWHDEHPELVKGYKCEYKKRKRASDPTYRLASSVSHMIRNALHQNKGGRHWEEFVDYSVEELMAHLESQFLPGMTRDNYGLWHVDHRRPICSFTFSSPDDPAFKECFALSNLQPLWAHDNISKGGRWDGQSDAAKHT